MRTGGAAPILRPMEQRVPRHPALRAIVATPATFARILRFQRVLRHRTAVPGATWAEVAAAAGYADPPHLVREFRRIAGIAPTAWAAAPKRHPNHVPDGR